MIGPALGLLIVVKLLDLGFFTAFDRPFNPVEDWSYASIGIETMRDTFGRTDAYLAVAVAALLGVAALVLPTLAVVQLTRVVPRHRRDSLRAAGALTAAWVVCWVVGAAFVSGPRCRPCIPTFATERASAPRSGRTACAGHPPTGS